MRGEYGGVGRVVLGYRLWAIRLLGERLWARGDEAMRREVIGRHGVPIGRLCEAIGYRLKARGLYYAAKAAQPLHPTPYTLHCASGKRREAIGYRLKAKG